VSARSSMQCLCERFVRSIKEGCLSRLIFFSEDPSPNNHLDLIGH